MSPEISVLVAVYNAAEYLPVCLTAISEQSFTNLEIICVNDGSKDRSLDVLHAFSAQEPRLKFIDQPNAGVAEVRNRLLQAARGKYVAFVDADDVIAPDYLAKLYQAAQENKAVIAKCFFKELSADGSILQKARCGRLFYQEPTTQLLSRYVCGYHDSVVWGKLFRRDFIEEKNLAFTPGRVAEDLPFVVQAFMEAPCITYVREALYFYRKGLSASITANSARMAVDILRNISELKTQLQQRKLWNTEVLNAWLCSMVWSICRFRKIPPEIRQASVPLQQQAFSHVQQASRQGSRRWRLYVWLVRLCGWRSIYVWSKIFR